MTSSSFPDVNVWVVLLAAGHEHHEIARHWWIQDQSEVIAFSRVTQISVLQLLTTAAVMGGRPLSMKGAWAAYDRLFDDGRVGMISEPSAVDASFRRYASGSAASPKVWADAYLLAIVQELGATLITFDRALARRSASCVLLASSS